MTLYKYVSIIDKVILLNWDLYLIINEIEKIIKIREKIKWQQ